MLRHARQSISSPGKTPYQTLAQRNGWTIRHFLPSESILILGSLTLVARMQQSGQAIQEALRDRELTPHWRNWDRQWELGVVAESECFGYPISRAWMRLFSGWEAGADDVGDDIPEQRCRKRRKQRRNGLEKTTARLSEAAGLSMPSPADAG